MKTEILFKSGELSCAACSIPFQFGHAREEDGIYHFQFYIQEDFDLAGLIPGNKNVFTDYYFKMKSTTVDLNIIEVTGLQATTITPHLFRIDMYSEGYLVHTDLSSFPANANLDINEMTLYYIEFEGLKMIQTDITEISNSRRGEEIYLWNNWERDHTPVMVMYDGDIRNANFFNITFFKSKSTENIVAQFSKKDDKPPTPITYGYFQSFKRDFLYFLSLMNGGDVKIRKEHLGGFISSEGTTTQTEIFYSYQKLDSFKASGYVPINSDWFRDEAVLHRAYTKCFNNFVNLNKLYDFNSIIYYLNGAQKIDSVDERFFISIIAFERLASNYVSSHKLGDEYLVSENEYEPIRQELVKIINNNKNVLGKGYSIILQKINEANKIKAASTRYKFKQLLNYASITYTPEITEILGKIRNTSIHMGEIGEGNEGVVNYYVLDEMIRDIILNLIKYEGPRYSAYRKNTIV